jgi:DNA-binding transcriptional MerR regulator
MKRKTQPDQKLYHTIGEAARMLDVNASTLRFWEKEFDCIKPFRNKRGIRFYHPEDLECLQLIHYLLKEKGFTIPGAREQIRNNRKQAATQLDLVNTLRRTRDFLIMLRDSID